MQPTKCKWFENASQRRVPAFVGCWRGREVDKSSASVVAVYCIHVCLVAYAASQLHLIDPIICCSWVVGSQQSKWKQADVRGWRTTAMLCERAGPQQSSVEGLLEVMVPEVIVGRGLHDNEKTASGGLGGCCTNAACLARTGHVEWRSKQGLVREAGGDCLCSTLLRGRSRQHWDGLPVPCQVLVHLLAGACWAVHCMECKWTS